MPIESEKLRAFKKSRGLTTLKLCELFGVSERTMYYWLNGGADRMPEPARRLLAVMGKANV